MGKYFVKVSSAKKAEEPKKVVRVVTRGPEKEFKLDELVTLAADSSRWNVVFGSMLNLNDVMKGAVQVSEDTYRVQLPAHPRCVVAEGGEKSERAVHGRAPSERFSHKTVVGQDGREYRLTLSSAGKVIRQECLGEHHF